jgi:hypothetical protein
MFILVDFGYRINFNYVSCWFILQRTLYFEIEDKTYKKTFEHSSDAELFAEYLDDLETIEEEPEQATDAYYHLLNTPINLN